METASHTSAALQENTIVPATVTGVTGTAAVVSFGWTAEGHVPLADFAKVDGQPQVKPGDAFEVLVESLGESPVVSKDKAERLRLWSQIAERCANGGPVEGTVVARLPGGYAVDIGIRAFLPGAQADLKRGAEGDALLGKTLEFKVTELDDHKLKIVLSRRAILEREERARQKALIANIAEGQVLHGVVKSLTDFGAFVDLGGVDGLLHVSQMSWGRVTHPREVVKVGDELTVQVVKYDKETRKIGLGLKQLQEDPWARVAERYAAGREVQGKVTSLTDFGAFVALEPGIEGLVHVSEISWAKVKHANQALTVGDEVKAVVLDVDAKARRISLGMKQLAPNPWKKLEAELPPGTKVRGKVRSVTDFGVFVELADGIDGLVHVSELSWTQKVKDPGTLYKKGDEVDALVLEFDAANERISLGVKQLTPDPWAQLETSHPVGSKAKGKVTRVVEFGAFVELEPGIEGLVHVSELAEQRTERASDVVKAGDDLEVQVVELDAERHKIRLSVRALTQLSRDEYKEHMKPSVDARTTLGDLFADKLKKP